MATASLTTSPTTIDSGASDNVSVTNTGHGGCDGRAGVAVVHAAADAGPGDLPGGRGGHRRDRLGYGVGVVHGDRGPAVAGGPVRSAEPSRSRASGFTTAAALPVRGGSVHEPSLAPMPSRSTPGIPAASSHPRREAWCRSRWPLNVTTPTSSRSPRRSCGPRNSRGRGSPSRTSTGHGRRSLAGS
jgi:hypothetical protein